MATLLIGAAINIGASILINKFFGPEGQDIVQEGPRLRDLGVSSSAYGEVRPIGFGSFRMGGNMIWSPGLREIVREERQDAPGKGGSGGGSQTTRTYEYRASFAIGFGEGPANKILKIWADSKLVYDATGETTGLGKFRFRFHPGDETQLPDPLIEADVGVGQAPAYRGEVYIVCDDWPLADFGNRVPNISALVAYKSSAQKLTRTFTVSPQPGTGAIGKPSAGVYNRRDDTWYVIDEATAHKYNVGGRTIINSEGDDPGNGPDEARVIGPDDFHYRMTVTSPSQAFIRWRKNDPYTGSEIYQFMGDGFATNDGGLQLGVMQTVVPGLGPVVSQWANGRSGQFNTTGRVYLENTGGDGNSILGEITELTDASMVVYDPYAHQRVFFTQDTNDDTTIYEGLILPTIGLLGNISASPDVIEIGKIRKNGVDVAGTTNPIGWCWLPFQNAIIFSYAGGLVKFDLDTRSVTAKNPAVSFSTVMQWSDSEFFAWGEENGDFITIAVDDLSVTSREPVSSFFTGANNGVWNDFNSTYISKSHSVIGMRSAGAVTVSPTSAQVFLNRNTSGTATLADIVSKLCLKSGLSSSDIDVTALTSINVDGYVLNNQTPLKDALRPLSRAYLFEAVETEFKVKFVRRGGSLALSVPIPQDDIGLANGGEEEPFREIRTQELELPRRIWVQYADKAQDYQQGSQSDARARFPDPAVRSDAEITLELPIALNATEARQIAQRQLYITWAERRSFEFSLPWTYINLDPTDSVETVLDTETARLRINQIEIGADLTLQVQAVLEDADADTSLISGDAGAGFVVPVVPDRSPTRFFGLNLPLLRNQDASLQEFTRGYFSMSGQSDRWPGGVLMRSKDEGATYDEVASQPGSGPWGVIKAALADPVSTTTWNPTQTFTVTMIVGGNQLETKTQLEVLNGANLAAICRRGGTAELVQWTTVTDLGDGSYTLSNLLRARRGTENESINHANGEFFVVINNTVTNSLRVELSERNKTLQFRPVTLGTLLEDASDVFFKYTGRDLKPYPVAHPSLSFAQNQDVTISWRRRTRFAGELRDGTDATPLNETLERYEIDVFNTTESKVVTTKTVNDATSFLYTKVEQENDGVGSSIALTITNPNAENGVNNWINETGLLTVRGADPAPFEGSNYFFGGNFVVTRAYQDIAIPTSSHAFIDTDTAEVFVTWRQNSLFGNDQGRIQVEFYDSSMTIIGSRFSGSLSAPTTWTLREQSVNIPVNTRTIRLFMEMNRVAGAPNDALFDVLTATLRNRGGSADFRFDIYQISGIVGRGSVTTIPFVE